MGAGTYREKITRLVEGMKMEVCMYRTVCGMEDWFTSKCGDLGEKVKV